MAVPRLRRSRRGGRPVFGLQDQVRLGKRKHIASQIHMAGRLLVNRLDICLLRFGRGGNCAVKGCRIY